MPTLMNSFYGLSRPTPDWKERKKAWIAHYMQKGCHLEKATECADKKRSKTSWPT